MTSTGVGRLSVGSGAADASRAATATGDDAHGGVKRRVVVELQWVGRGGRFRHVVVGAPGWRLLGIVGIVTVLGLLVVGELVLVSQRALALDRIDAIVRENTTLRERQEVLRERAFDLADQLYWRVEQQDWRTELADSPGHALLDECPRPPARDAGSEAILGWLSEHGGWLEKLGSDPVAGRDQTGARQASDQATAGSGTAPAADGARLQVASVGSNK